MKTKMYTYIDPEVLLQNFFESKRPELLRAYAEKKRLKDFYQLMDKIESKQKELAYKRLHKLKSKEDINNEIINYMYMLRNSSIIGNIVNDFLKMYTTE